LTSPDFCLYYQVRLSQDLQGQKNCSPHTIESHQLHDQPIPEQPQSRDIEELSPEEEGVLSRIDYTGTSKGELLEKSSLGGGHFFQILIELESKGLIREEPGGAVQAVSQG